MASRKRKLSTDSNNHSVNRLEPTQDPAKRLKLVLGQTSRSSAAEDEEEGAEGKSTQQDYYTIKSIIKEKKGRYLIDWEDDPNTGEKFKPSWEPRRHANASAIADWASKKKEKGRQARKRKVVSAEKSSSPAAITLSGPLKPRRELRASSPDTSPDTSPSEPSAYPQGSVQTRQEAVEVQDSQQPELPTPAPLRLAVQISQHSSFDRDQYVQFIASSSVQGLSSSQPQDLDSGLGSSSPFQQTVADPVAFYRAGIVPDSQSLPGSSSYIPTSSISVDTSADSVARAASPGSRSNPFEDVTLGVVLASTPPVEVSDIIEDPSSPVGRQHACDNHRIDTTPCLPPAEALKIPVCNEGEPNRSNKWQNGATLESAVQKEPREEPQSSQLARCAEDQSGILIPQDNCVQATEGSSAALNYAQGQEKGCHHQEDIPTSSLVFQSQIPLTTNDQPSQHTPGTESALAGENWQSGQIVAQVARSTSQVSSGSRGEALIPIHQPEELLSQHDVLEVTEGEEAPQAESELFTISQDRAENSEGPRGTDPLVLSQRDPNFQSARSLLNNEKDVALATIELNSEDRSSSQIPTAPSQLPETFDSHAPSQPPSVSADDDGMSEIPQALAASQRASPNDAGLSSGGPPATSLREKLRNMRANSAALSRAQADLSRSARSTKSPSVIPDRSSQATQDKADPKLLETSLKMVVSQTLSHLPAHHSKLDLHKEMSQQLGGSSSLGPPRLGKMEFVVPLPMNARVTDQYQQTIFNFRNVIERFVQDEVERDSTMIAQMHTMIERINKITAHSDLDNDSATTQHEVSAADEANWAEACSAKFQFLRQFIDAARTSDMHVVVLASSGRLLDILETFLKGRRAVYVRPDKMRRSDSTAEGPLKFTLLATTESSFIISTAALVIAFDGSVNAQDPRITAFRVHMLRVGQLSPLIHLLVANSAEHIDRCLPSSLKGPQRLQALVSCVAQTRHKVGQLPLEMPGPVAAAEEVTAYLALGGLEDQWTLPQMPEIANVEFVDSSTTADSSTQSATQRSTLDAAPTSSVNKRPMLQSNVNELQQALKTAEEQLGMLRAQYTSREAELQNTIIAAQQRLQEHIDALSALQFRYESRTTDLHKLRAERDAAAVATAQAQRRCETQSAGIANLKEQQTTLVTELREAQIALESSAIPEIATLEKTKAEARQLAVDKAQLEKRLASLTKDFEFTRQQYQHASTAAAENASALTDLQSEVSALKQQASGEAVRLRQLNISNESQVHLGRAKQLEATLEEREELLRKKEEELREMKRGRGLATRASSAPRSPRLGSRASSPVPGFLGSAGRGSALRFG
ncbi:MAG: hypothetical protein M1830_009989 [Pleopsidium flavum]|nr:MAG: hypothetical protein M1830_009989 [Pleopsidium flavum]